MPWKYLCSEIFKARYAIAAYFLRDCPFVVEIGGYKTPISGFLKPEIKSLVIDPKTNGYEDNSTKHIAKCFQEVDLNITGEYGVAILGLDLNATDNDWSKLYTLINGAKTVVVEISVIYKPGQEQFQKILNNTNKIVANQLVIDLSNNDLGDLKDSAPPHLLRTIFILTSK